MPTVTITAKYVNAAGEGKKYGSIVDQDGNRYPASPHHVAKVQQGQTVTLDYDEQTWSGKPVMVVSKVHDGAENSHPPLAQQGAPPPRPNGHANGSAQHSAAEDIFVTGVVGRAMGSGQFGAADIENLTLAAAGAYRRWKGGANPPAANGRATTTRNDLNDEIPW